MYVSLVYILYLCFWSQVWSVLYVSWPALVLLLWACAIWLIPRVNPRKSLYYTSPLLVIYALALLLLQYINSLELTELPHHPSLGRECSEEGAVVGCRSLVLLFKVMSEGCHCDMGSDF